MPCIGMFVLNRVCGKNFCLSLTTLVMEIDFAQYLFDRANFLIVVACLFALTSLHLSIAPAFCDKNKNKH